MRSFVVNKHSTGHNQCYKVRNATLRDICSRTCASLAFLTNEPRQTTDYSDTTIAKRCIDQSLKKKIFHIINSKIYVKQY